MSDKPYSLRKSARAFEEAQAVLPGGVNSPVRAFKSVGGTPPFIKKAKGAYLEDIDGNKYVDYVGSWGPMLFGHADPDVIKAVKKAANSSTSFGAPTQIEIEVARLVCDLVPSIEKVRFVNSGTEATMSAVRLARGFTGRDKMIKFEGNYHGHGDSFLIAAGSGAMTFGQPNSPGVTQGVAKDTLLARYNDLSHVQSIIEANPGEIACIILEPIAGNMGCVPPVPGFLEGLRSLCDQHGIVLIFDEVMTGFRVARGGAQELYNVIPDLTTLGKIVGGGLPVGAYGGKREIMDQVSPVGPVYQAGTLSGNPLAMHAGYAILKKIADQSNLYDHLEIYGGMLDEALSGLINELDLPCRTTRVGSMGCLFFCEEEVVDYTTAKKCDTNAYAAYFHEMLKSGVYIAPSQFEAYFFSTLHGTEEFGQTIRAQRKALSALREVQF